MCDRVPEPVTEKLLVSECNIMVGTGFMSMFGLTSTAASDRCDPTGALVGGDLKGFFANEMDSSLFSRNDVVTEENYENCAIRMRKLLDHVSVCILFSISDGAIFARAVNMHLRVTCSDNVERMLPTETHRSGRYHRR